jgi:hypothetical protein
VIARCARNLIEARVDDRGSEEDALTLEGAERQRIVMDTDVREVLEAVGAIGHVRTRSQIKCRLPTDQGRSE